MTLTIEPGVEVILDTSSTGAFASVAGSLIVKGTSSQKIVFSTVGEWNLRGGVFHKSGDDYSMVFDHIVINGRSGYFMANFLTKFSLTNSYLSNFSHLQFNSGTVSGNTLLNVITIDVDWPAHGQLEQFTNNCIKYLGERKSSGAITRIRINSPQDGTSITGNSFYYIADTTFNSGLISSQSYSGGVVKADLSNNYWGGLSDEEVKARMSVNPLTFVVDTTYLPTLSSPHPDTPSCGD